MKRLHFQRVCRLAFFVLLLGVAWSSVPDAAGQDRAALQRAASVQFERATEVEAHLPQSSVYAIVEDTRGFLWFATREGVGRWDGYEMRTWKHDPFDAASLPGNVVRELIQDRDGNFWLSAQNYLQEEVGLARIVAPAHEEVRRYGFPGARPFLDEAGRPLLATADSLYRYDAARDRFVAMLARTRPDLPARYAFTDRSGMIWISAGAAGLEACDRTRRACRFLPWGAGEALSGESVTGRLLEDTQGRLWVGSVRGLGHLDAARQRILPFNDTPPRLAGHYVADFRQGADGLIWMLTSDGVYRFDADAKQFERFPLYTLGEDTQNLAPVALHIDRAGSVWVGTVWGLYRYDPHRKPFGHLQHDPRNPRSLSAGLVVSLLEDPNGDLWVGTIGGGLNRVDRQTGDVTRYRHDPADPSSLSHDIVWTLDEGRDGAVWAGTSHGLNRYDPARDGFRRYLVAPAHANVPNLGVADVNAVSGIVCDGQGRLWMNTASNDLVRFVPGEEAFARVPVPDSLDIGYMTLADPQTLWLGASRGLFQMDLRTEVVTRVADWGEEGDLDGLLTFHRDRQGRPWVGTNSGLYRLGPDHALAARFSDADGLPSSTVYGLLEDDAGRLWLSTNRGLASFDPALPPAQGIRTYDHTSGLRNTEFNRLAYLRTRDGTFFFGGDQGVTFFHPDAIRDNPYRPPVVLTAFHRATRQGTTTQRYLSGEEVVVAPGEYAFSFEFAALNFTHAHRNRYAVMLEGFDEQWIDLGTQRRAAYTNVPPGRYAFRVRASNDDGLWNEAGVAVPLRVLPHFWQTAWFRLLVAGLFVGLVAAAGWAASRRKYRRALLALQAQQALEQERARISRDMHDEVGASLTEIAILSELARRENGEGDATGYLDKIAGTSRAMLDSISEIIWAINPHNDRLDRLAAYLREYAAGYLENTDVRATLRFPATLPEVRVTAEFRRNVFLVMKEALHNLVRHAEATHARVTLSVEDGQLDLVIEDDGRGFDVEATGARRARSNGLRNMQQRAEELGGALDLDATPGAGTRLHLHASLAEANHIIV